MADGYRAGWVLAGLIAAAFLLGACGTAPYSGARLAERHCYRTLAEVDCYAQPPPGEAGRKVGFFDAPLAR